jgi:hypothetical protein
MMQAKCEKLVEYVEIIDHFFKKVVFDPAKEIVLFRGQNCDRP